MKEGDKRVIVKSFIFPRRIGGNWCIGKTKVKQELRFVPLEFVGIYDWFNIEILYELKGL